VPPRKSSKKAKRRRDGGTHASPAEHHHERGPWQDFVAGLLFFAVLTTINIVWIEPSLVGQEVKRMAYAFIQARLAMTREDSPTEVAVVDITGLPPCKTGSGKNTVFPRQALKEALEAVLAQQPAAIGVDIDFAPGPNVSCDPSPQTVSAEKIWDFTDRGGPQLFQFALNKDKTPIFLGVFRTQDLPPSQWLGGEAYEKLAAALLVPPEKSVFEENEPTPYAERDGKLRFMPRAVRTKDGTLLTLSAAIYEKHSPQKISSRRWLAEHFSARWLQGLFVTQKIERPGEDVFVDEYLVDFSAIKELEDKHATFKKGTLYVPPTQSLARKVVLLGYIGRNKSAGSDDEQPGSQQFYGGNEAEPEGNTDKFPLGSTGEMKAGVYWHACGADTLIRGVLAWPTRTGRVLLDALFYVPVLLAILWLRLRYKAAFSAHKMESIFTKVMAVMVVIFGFVVINSTRLVWDDFVLVALLVALHPWLAEVAEKAIVGLRSVASSALNRVRA